MPTNEKVRMAAIHSDLQNLTYPTTNIANCIDSNKRRALREYYLAAAECVISDDPRVHMIFRAMEAPNPW
jgi:hypothetical protein